ncbi:MAG: hypothetical protein ACRBCS_10750 [Cellvibrionaceae bacterium]
MQYFVKELPNRKAAIYAEDGYLLKIFDDIWEAIVTCRQECRVNPQLVKGHYSYLQSSPLDFESSFV